MHKNRNLYSCYLQGKEDNHGKVAIHCGDRHYSYADLADGSARYANALADMGVSPGDRVCACIDKSIGNIFLYLACLRSGIVYQPLNPAFQPAEVDYYLADAGPAAVICSRENEVWVRTAARRAGVERVLTLDRDGTGTLAAAADAAGTEFATRVYDGSELACLLYSSGTTGKPKGIKLSHDNLAANVRTLVDLWGFTNDDVLIHALPLFHVHGLFVALGCVLTAGASLHLLEKFDADEIICLLPEATVLMGVPTFYTRLLQSPGLSREACSAMRLFISGSAPLQENTFNQFKQTTGHTILERYGTSETGMSTSNPLHGERRAGMVGMPLPDVMVKIVDDDGTEVADAGIGELLVKGPNVFSGYWNLDEVNRGAFTEDGYYRTGDLGERDPDGYIRIVGRARDMIISGGENVYPKEIELCLDRIEGISESAVIGLEDTDLGERVVAVLVADPDCRLDEAGIVAGLKTQLAGFKVPRQICFVEELPRNTMGKVQKNKLRETWKQNHKNEQE
ncbi:MAG: AMP-binding protein [Gammaproteobacteria bacterium]|nr:AMP-binding protein [Gammaproteobacteria bacterium]